MAKVQIDGHDYETEAMSQEAKGRLEMLMLCDQKIRQLQGELAMMQTARQAYANALKAVLVAPSDPILGLGETIQ
ncbi:MAG: hypothetical protein EBS54_00735 [Betaproteobacteria bacterium]|nr:hypothetical protein [Betaproteobacteria bacterium]NBT05320.1 hypothetical protein [Betaproteobacteria bacterium]NDE53232.1 hypothetical protein [Actinomycetota bacterium]